MFGVTQASDSSNVRVGVRALSIPDGKLRSLRVPPGQLTTLRISPDGRRIAYFVNDVSVELWKMDEPVFGVSRASTERR